MWINWDGAEIAPTLTKNNAGGGQRMPDKENFNCVIGGENMAEQLAVRRLTPLECERLQGFPEVMEVNLGEMTKDEYIAFNIAIGNIIVDAKEGEIYVTRGPGGVKLDMPRKLEGSNLNGYKVYSIRNGKLKYQCRGHRIVWISQNGIIPKGYVIDHINNDKSDNRISNLQLLKPEENSHKASIDGLYLCGDENPAGKISEEQRWQIIDDYFDGNTTYRKLAEKYGISKSRIGQIIKSSGWTDIGEWVDTKGKKHKEADSPRYKALGNSIALPFWQHLINRISDTYTDRVPTMASLFDGIGGFPLCWENRNGKGTAIWASEIEEFPIAVTKIHFPEGSEVTI